MSEVLDLPLEVFLLVGGADARVDDLGLFLLAAAAGNVTEEAGEVGLVVEALAAGELGEAHLALEGPLAEAGGGDGILLLDPLGRDEHGGWRGRRRGGCWG